MKVKEISSQFITERPHIFGLVIECDGMGFESNIDELVDKSKHFTNIFIKGNEPFEQKEEVVKLIKKIIKQNNQIKIFIYTTGKVRPPSILENTTYWVNVQLKNSGIEYHKRIHRTNFEWYVQLSANFVFYLNDIDDVDEAEILIKDLGIPKRLVYFGSNNVDNYNQVIYDIRVYCMTHGYNYLSDVNKVQ
jgi:hypothetical protein